MDCEDFERDDFNDRYADDLEALHDLEGNSTHEEEVYPSFPFEDSYSKKRSLVKNSTDTSELVSTSQKDDDDAVHQTTKKLRQSNETDFGIPDFLDVGDQSTPLVIDEDETIDSGNESNKKAEEEGNENITKANPLKRETLFSEYTEEPSKSRKFDPSVDSIAVTGFDRKRVYVRLFKDDIAIISSRDFRTGDLLGIPYRVLRDQVEREREAKLINKSSFEVDILIADSSNSDGNQVKNELESGHQLWVEKFKPKCYTELLSDDGINRTMLCWLKQWDTVVFGKELKAKLNTSKEKPKEFVSFKDNFITQKLMERDELKRPFFKVALLCGNPGLGKTTLSYIIAKHAGYNVVEMNASDDRSQEIFQRQLESATQMRSVIGKDPKPNCLIIDEIDGAPAASINVLVSYIKAVKSSKKNAPVLLRPIICICNDLYTPALRNLRQIAFVLNFPPTVSARLATRLTDITRDQLLRTDRTTLLALCEKTSNDIRSCLSTLQFLGNSNKTVKLLDIQKVNIGQKDMQKSIFSIWQSIFQIPRAKRKHSTMASGVESVDETSLNGRFKNILNDVSRYGEYEKLLQGVHENYLNVNFKDPLLENLNQGSEWFCFFDTIQQHISRSQNYTLMRYLPYTMVTFHFLYSVPLPSKLNYPSGHFEQRSRQAQMKNIIESMYSFVSPTVRSSLNVPVLAMQVFPFLNFIIQPALRPVNIQLYSEREKSELKQVIAVMSAYNLTYRQERSPEGVYSFILEPNIEEVIRFPGLKIESGLSYATKNLISRELDLEKMRRSEGGSFTVKEHVKPKVVETVPNHKKVLEPKKIYVKEIQAFKDFFGREIVRSGEEEPKKGSAKDLGTGDVWFHFKEGYSNAARHTVLIKDLL